MRRRAALAALAGTWTAGTAAGAASEPLAAPPVPGPAAPAVACWGGGACWIGRMDEPLQRLAAHAAIAPAPVAGGVWLALDDGGVQRWQREGGAGWQGRPAVRLGEPVHALAAAAPTRWALAAHGDRLSLLDAGGRVVKSYEGTDLERRRRGPAAALRAHERRRSFVVSWPALGEWWEIALDPDAPPIFDGLVHDYRMKEGIAAPGYLGVRRLPLGEPVPSPDFADPRAAWLAGRVDGAVAVVHLDVRRRIATLPLAGARPEASLLWSAGATLQWWLPGADTLQVVDVARWSVLERRTVPGAVRALQAVGGTVWALVGDAPRTELFAWRGRSWQPLPLPAPAIGGLVADPAGQHALLWAADPPGLLVLDRDAAVVQRRALPPGTAVEGAAWL